ncbi:uncharacterized protein LOC131247857 [Magnolia sinica]|uniref:uncharacterized protein LOC131247857 n=1 Tax=Magnolia sinica TaxID=86752 RepID=UPI00265B5E7F|nr:uncharacterized protein LOC131247857 [Magnolia sinica]XP_058103754.1 uncharacterized protein LOC131247857 [Magnolia sinica]XP_058103755.1 uncharacterized protein LOC131247857 [Magnolia sinica]
MMGLFLELMTNTIVLATKPCTLIRLLCLVGAKIVGIVTFTWLQLVKAFINFHVDVCWGILIWTIALISLPFRVLNALQRERVLEIHLQAMQIDLDNLVCEKKELEERLHIALKDRGIMETVLAEIDEEHDKAIARIDLLENKLQDLKDENLRLSETHGKDAEYFTAHNNVVGDDDYDIPLVADYDVPSWKSGYDGSGANLQDLMHGDAWEDETDSKPRKQVFLKPGSKVARPYPFSPRIVSRNLTVDEEALDRRRGVALSQSLFSTFLSLLVGMIVWEAEDPCLPLVVALFTVVGMSLKSVVQFFSTIKNRPASDAVALLSFNCFILGTLASPTLPTVARMLAPQALRLADWMIYQLGFLS